MSNLVIVRKDGIEISRGYNLLMNLGKEDLAGAFVAVAPNAMPTEIWLGTSNAAAEETQTELQGIIYGSDQTPGIDWLTIVNTVVTTVSGQITYTFNLNNYQKGGDPTIQEFALRSGVGASMFARYVTAPFILTFGSSIVVDWTLNFLEA